MKRLRKLVTVTLAWTSVCLLSIDPVSACRLLNRRCCTCCCPVEPTYCGDKSAPPAAEPSPSDQPRPMASDATPPTALPTTSTPTSPSVDLQPSSGFVRGPAGTPQQPAATGGLIPHQAIVKPETSVPTIERARANADRPVTATAPPAAGEAPRRQPSDVPPPATTSAATAEFGPQPSTPLSNTAPMNVGPQKTTLMPKQMFSPAGPAVNGAPSPERPGAATNEPAATSKRSPSDNSPATGIAETSPSTSTRQPAALGGAPSAGTIVKPEFPTVGDDPFAPRSAPPATETHADDPFAPLPASPTTNDNPADPLVVEPTLKKIDMLAPGTDGRLPLREWSDRTGKFTVTAKLVLVLDGKVRLLKETGRTTTVALERLSQDDRAYVAAAIERYGEDLAKLHQFASR